MTDESIVLARCSTEHDIDVIVTEQGLADVRGLSPRERAKLISEFYSISSFRCGELTLNFNLSFQSTNVLTLTSETNSWISEYSLAVF